TEAQRLPNVTGKQWVLRMILSSDAAVGSLADHVYVTTSHPRQRQVDIPITGFVRPSLAATPSEAQFGSAEPPIGKILIVHNFSNQSIVLMSVESDTRGVEVSLEPVEPGREYNLKIALQTTIAKGPLNGKITIHTNSQKVPVLVVPLKGTIR
ncbi:MAG: hypothetical protein M3R68_08510, partial [Acidobacteriota bacterium]|nr:hypothetical protein [Acidobacteriota bacterium]